MGALVGCASWEVVLVLASILARFLRFLWHVKLFLVPEFNYVVVMIQQVVLAATDFLRSVMVDTVVDPFGAWLVF